MDRYLPLDPALPFGFNVCGFISCDFGLGIAARNTIRILQHQGFPISVFDVPLQGRSGADTSFISLHASKENPFPYAITLFQVGPDLIPYICSQCEQHLTGRMKVAVPFWELPDIPSNWNEIFNSLHCILAPSTFIQSALEKANLQVPILPYPQTVFLPDNIKVDRARWNLPENSLIFIQSFDIASDIERKNPIGTVKAFRNAFKDSTEVQLLLSIHDSIHQQSFTLVAETFIRSLKDYKNITPLFHDLSYEDILSLYASSDIVVSLHRSEGLGLSIMEAMFLGKPIIVTGWSGNLDFTDRNNSLVVNSFLIPAKSLSNPYINPNNIKINSLWAEPDLREASDLMRRCLEDTRIRQLQAESALESIHQWHSTCLEADQFHTITQMYQEMLCCSV